MANPEMDRANELPNEQEVVRRAAAGDKDAFGVLYRAYAPRIYAVVYGLLMNRDEALDVTQVAFLRAWRALPRFQLGRPVFPWLYAIARNRSFSRMASNKASSQAVELQERHGSASDGHDRMVELRHDLGSAMAKLSLEQREIIVFRHFQSLSYKEIALVIGCPVGTVMSRLHNTRKALRVLMMDWEDDT